MTAIGGAALGSMFLLAVAFVKPIGVSTQFVILDGIIWNAFSNQVIVENTNSKSGYFSTNAYLNKSGGKYAKNVANPLNYSFVFVVAMVLGSFVASKLQTTKTANDHLAAPAVFRGRFGNSSYKRYRLLLSAGSWF